MAGWVEATALLGLAGGRRGALVLAERRRARRLAARGRGPAQRRTPAGRMPPDPSGVALNVTGPATPAASSPSGRTRDHGGSPTCPSAGSAWRERRRLAGEPSDTAEVRPRRPRGGCRRRGARSASSSTSGAPSRAAPRLGRRHRAHSRDHAHTTSTSGTQFGRQIGRFQAGSTSSADIAAETALARAATDAAIARAAASDWARQRHVFAVGRGQVVRQATAWSSSRNAHQVLGAIGTTLEHELHTLTKPILARRSEYGSLAGQENNPHGPRVVCRARPALEPRHHRPRQAVECALCTARRRM